MRIDGNRRDVMGMDGPRRDKRGAEPVRDHIICVAADSSVLSALQQQLGEWLGESYALDAVGSLPSALQLFDDLQRLGESVALVLVEHDLLGGSGPAARRGVGDSGVSLLIEAHQRFPIAGKVLLIDPEAHDHTEAVAHGVRHAGLSSYLHQPYPALQLRLTV